MCARHGYTLRQAHYYDQSGALAAGTGIWLRTSSSFCRTSAATGTPAAPCAAAGDEVRTDYDYGPEGGPNTLLLRGQAVTSTDGGITTTLRSCYAYDSLGRRISETSADANLASCPAGPPATALPSTSSTRYDAGNRVTGTISADPDGAGGNPFLAVRTTYDAAGRPIRVETGSLAAWQSEAVARRPGAGSPPRTRSRPSTIRWAARSASRSARAPPARSGRSPSTATTSPEGSTAPRSG